MSLKGKDARKERGSKRVETSGMVTLCQNGETPMLTEKKKGSEANPRLSKGKRKEGMPSKRSQGTRQSRKKDHEPHEEKRKKEDS